MFANEVELRNLFKFLTDKAVMSGEKAAKESLLYGLENYALDLPPNILKDLKETITKDRNDFISFDEFKKFWVSNVITIPDTQKFAQQTFQMIRDKIHNKFTDESQITLEGIEMLLQKLDEEGIISNLKNKSVEDRRRLAKKMIQAIDLEGTGTVGNIDLEFLIENYLNSLKKQV